MEFLRVFVEGGVLGICKGRKWSGVLQKVWQSRCFSSGVGGSRHFCDVGEIVDVFATRGQFAGWGGGGPIDIFATWGTIAIFLQKGWKFSMFCIRVEARGIFAGGDP